MTLDTRHPRGPEVLRRLVRTADVVVESARPGAMDDAGFGYADAAAENPAVVWCSITGFGQDGPYADRPGHDVTYMAQSGLLAALGESLPWMPQIMLTVPLGAVMAVVGILAALEGRRDSGKGCQIDISLSEAGSWILSGAVGLLGGQRFVIPVTADRRLYRCGDGRYVSVAAAEPRTWRTLCEGLDVPDLVETLHAPPDQQAAVIERLEAIFATRPAAEWVDKLGGSGAAVGPVNDGQEIVEDPHAKARGAFVEVAGMAVPANPLRLRDLDGLRSETSLSPPPELGANTDEALVDAGFSAEEIADLRASGAT
jgi:crotonobetainyl-CoA:carnitine CoA-transferase CaiB-like acyl-CoA transferase